MYRASVPTVVFALLLTYTGSTWSQQVVNLTWDPHKEAPTIVSRSTSQIFTFQSIDYTDRGNSLGFQVVLPNFVGQYDPGFPNGTPCVDNVPNTGDVTCTSVTTNQGGGACEEVVPPAPAADKYKCQEVRIKLASPASFGPGYTYRVIMNGEVLDPRLRGN